MPGVFLSYARADGEDRAAELRERLARQAPDIHVTDHRRYLVEVLGHLGEHQAAVDGQDGHQQHEGAG